MSADERTLNGAATPGPDASDDLTLDLDDASVNGAAPPPPRPKSKLAEAVREAIAADVVTAYRRVYPDGNFKLRGSEYRYHCHQRSNHDHGDQNPSADLNPAKGVYFCRLCNASGDLFTLYQELHGCDFKTALYAMADLFGVTTKANDHDGRAKLSVVSSKKTKVGPVIRHIIKSIDGTPVAVHCRQYHKTADGKRDKTMWWGRPDGKKGLGGIRVEDLPLYLSEKLPGLSKRGVVVTEGEMAASATNKRKVPAVGTVTGAGVCPSDEVLRVLVPFEPMLMPDNHKQGREHMARFARGLARVGRTCWLIDTSSLPEGGDAADFKGTDEEFRAMCLAAKEYDPGPEPDSADTTASEPGKQEQWEKDRDLARRNRPFTVLGFSLGNNNRKIFHYQTKLSDSITSLTAAQHRENNLFELAQAAWWQKAYPVLYTSKDKSGQLVTTASMNGEIDWRSAVSDHIAEGSEVGFVDPGRFTRGVGFWRDNARIVFHKGDGIICDGKTVKLGDFVSPDGYVYGTRDRVRIGASAATDEEARHLLDVCNDKAIIWENKIAGRLFAGWIGIARLTGCLSWRPHVWLTAGENAGKSTLLIHVAAPALGGETGGMLHVIGGGQTTEAHVRQSLGNDSKVVIYDEADPEDQRAQQRLRAVLSYVRAANMAGRIGKGSAEGFALNYSVASIFLIAAISNPLNEAADVRRVTLLSLTRPARTDEQHRRWAEFSAKIEKIITPEFGRKLLTRLIENAETVLTNVARYHFALIPKVNDPGMADQLAPLLAGAHFLETTEAIDPADADAEVQALDLSPFTFAAKDESHDEARLFSDLMAAKIRITLEDTRGRTFSDDRAIGELIQTVRSCSPPAENSEHDALRRIGIRVATNGDLLIKVHHVEISKLLRGNKWEHNYAAALRRLRAQFGLPDDSKEGGKSARFADGIVGEAVVLPWAMLAKLFDED